MDTLQLGSDAQFQDLRTFLKNSEFSESAVCRAYGIDHLGQFESVSEGEEVTGRDTLSTLIRLFIDGRYVPVDSAAEYFGRQQVQTMADLGLIRTKFDDPSVLYSPVALYPTAGVYVVSDRWNSPEREAFPVPVDIVYPAIVANSQRFLRFLPANPCESFLDLCCGAGAAALTSARRFAQHSFAFDIAERSAQFAEFNQRLNGVQNMTVAIGDLYAPARGQTFDRVVAHPPYVPTVRPSWKYLDGGDDGEALMQRIVAELPRVLRPGGLLYMLTTGTDRRGAGLPQRVRGWLGAAESEFDVAVVQIRTIAPDDFAMRSSIKSKTPEEDMRQLQKRFETLQVERMVYGIILVGRVTEPRPTFTVRRQTGPSTGPDELLGLMRREALLAGPGSTDAIFRLRLRPNPAVELTVRHKLGEEGWATSGHLLRTDNPFSMEANTDDWAPYLLANCDGESTVAEQFQHLKQEGIVPAESQREEFARALGVLISGGFLLADLPA